MIGCHLQCNDLQQEKSILESEGSIVSSSVNPVCKIHLADCSVFFDKKQSKEANLACADVTISRNKGETKLFCSFQMKI
jgi:hypothetical protein